MSNSDAVSVVCGGLGDRPTRERSRTEHHYIGGNVMKSGGESKGDRIVIDVCCSVGTGGIMMMAVHREENWMFDVYVTAVYICIC